MPRRSRRPRLYEDRLIRQAIKADGSISTIRKRLPKEVGLLVKEIQDQFKQSNGQTLPVVAFIKKTYNLDLTTATKLVKEACGVTELADREQSRYHRNQMVKQ